MVYKTHKKKPLGYNKTIKANTMGANAIKAKAIGANEMANEMGPKANEMANEMAKANEKANEMARANEMAKAKANEMAKANAIGPKRCYNDTQMGEICSTGQYSTYAGNFYKNKKHLEQFADIKAKFKKDPKYKKYKTQNERYTKFLTDNFKAGELPKLLSQIKDDFYGYANAEWLKEIDLEKQEKILCSIRYISHGARKSIL